MTLEWDVLFDAVSIRNYIDSFTIVSDNDSYVRQLTLFSVDPDFFDSIDYAVTPELKLEVKTKLADTWVSQGKFFIEKPAYQVEPDTKISRGVWGRSETAKAGELFAVKISKTWESSTTIQTIMQEMADLVGLDIVFNIDDYPVYSNAYTVESFYPINVISELCTYCGAFVCTNSEGQLVINKHIFHATSSDFTIDDTFITSISEKKSYPEFGNRIKVGSFSSNAGYTISIKQATEVSCVLADGTSKLKLYCFVENEGEPVEDGILVNWSSTLGTDLQSTISETRKVLISNQVYKADNFNKITVDYSIYDIIGIWKYSDQSHSKNYWDASLSGCSFSGNEIFVHNSFEFCDQTLVITYITSGCAINILTAGTIAGDSIVTAEIDGAEASLEISVGNTCSCGASLNAIKNTDSDICFGNSAPILIWAEMNGGSAAGMIASLTLTGCGRLSSTKKVMKTIPLKNEVGYVINEISDVSQVSCRIYPSGSIAPKVYLATDTNKSNDLYDNHSGKVIDLSTQFETGTEVIIDYTCDGCASVAWLTDDISVECDAEILVKMGDGTEAGLHETVSISATDCTENTEDPIESDYNSSDDPSDFDNDGPDGGDSKKSRCIDRCEGSIDYDRCVDDCDKESGTGALTDCDIIVLNRITNSDTMTTENKDSIRFGTNGLIDCEKIDPYGCPCSELCESEINEKGNTYDYNKTIHETVIETYEEGTPEYYEAYETTRSENLSECIEKCDYTRAQSCGGCEIVSGSEVLAPGESAEYVCSDGTVEMVTMPEDGCGTHTFTVGCCSFKVRSTDGYWKLIDGSCYGGSAECSEDDHSIKYCYTIQTSGTSNPEGITCTPSDGWICGMPCGLEDSCADNPQCYHSYKKLGTYQWDCL